MTSHALSFSRLYVSGSVHKADEVYSLYREKLCRVGESSERQSSDGGWWGAKSEEVLFKVTPASTGVNSPLPLLLLGTDLVIEQPTQIERRY